MTRGSLLRMAMWPLFVPLMQGCTRPSERRCQASVERDPGADARSEAWVCARGVYGVCDLLVSALCSRSDPPRAPLGGCHGAGCCGRPGDTRASPSSACRVRRNSRLTVRSISREGERAGQYSSLHKRRIPTRTVLAITTRIVRLPDDREVGNREDKELILWEH